MSKEARNNQIIKSLGDTKAGTERPEEVNVYCQKKLEEFKDASLKWDWKRDAGGEFIDFAVGCLKTFKEKNYKEGIKPILEAVLNNRVKHPFSSTDIIKASLDIDSTQTLEAVHSILEKELSDYKDKGTVFRYHLKRINCCLEYLYDVGHISWNKINWPPGTIELLPEARKESIESIEAREKSEEIQEARELSKKVIEELMWGFDCQYPQQQRGKEEVQKGVLFYLRPLRVDSEFDPNKKEQFIYRNFIAENLSKFLREKKLNREIIELVTSEICNNLGVEETKEKLFEYLKEAKTEKAKKQIFEALKFIGYKNPKEVMEEVVGIYENLDLENYWFTEKFTGQEFAFLTGATENRNLADGRIKTFEISKEPIYQKPGALIRVYTKEFTPSQSFIIKPCKIDYQIDFEKGIIEFKEPPPKDAIVQTLYWTAKDYRNKKGIFPLKDFEDKDFVELACGQGRLLKLFHQFGYRVSGLDIMENYLEDIKKDPKTANIRLDRGDFTRQPFKNQSIRGLYSMMHSIMHLVFPHDQQNFFGESNRVMIAGDKLVFDTPDSEKGPYNVLIQKYFDKMENKGIFNFREGTIYDTPNGFNYCTRYAPSEKDIKNWAEFNRFKIVKKIKRAVDLPEGYIDIWAKENQIASWSEDWKIISQLKDFRKTGLSAEKYFEKNKNTLLVFLGTLKEFEKSEAGAEDWFKENYYVIPDKKMKRLEEQASEEKYTNIYWVLEKKK